MLKSKGNGNPAILSKGRRSMHLELIDHYEGMYLHMEKWPVRECQTHFHPDIEFMLMLNGKVECLTSSQNFLLTAGDIFIINSNQPHALVSPTSGCTVIWLAIHPSSAPPSFPPSHPYASPTRCCGQMILCMKESTRAYGRFMTFIICARMATYSSYTNV